jgi:putative ABC transport system permease protein
MNPEGEMLRMWGKDFSLAIRSLAKRPGFTATIVITLAFGVGATTSLFGVFKAVFLQPLDLPDSDELVVVMETAGFGCCGPASGPDYVDWVQRQRSFEGMALLGPGNFNLTGLDQAERVYATRVTANAFDFLGAAPILGRGLLAEDQEVGGVVVLGHGLWERLFDSRADVLDETLEINGSPHAIVGVMPRGFDVPSPWAVTRAHEFFTPFLDEDMNGSRGNHSFPVFARLVDGVDVEQAQLDMDRIMRELGVEYPETNGDRGARVFTAHEFRYGRAGRQFAMLLAAAALVLLIACGNVASLQLARAAGRETELAVRSAMGASRKAIVRLLFSESLLLSMLGGGAGVIVTVLAVERLKSLLPPTVPRIDQIAVDGWVLVFALGASVMTALLFGMLPAVFASRTDLASGVREGGYGTFAPSKERLRDAFIVGQIAMGLVLANGAGLLVQSYSAVRGQDYGFEAEGVLTLALSARGSEYTTSQSRQRFYEDIVRTVDDLPGVSSVGFVSKLPLQGGSNGNVQLADGDPRTNRNEGPLVEVSSVTGDYFDAMGIPLIRGRTLQPDDSIPGSVGVLINQAMADALWPGQDPLGKQFGFDVEPPWLTVVGVVGTVRQWGVEQAALPETYFPYSRGWGDEGYVVARVGGDPAAMIPAVRAAIRDVDPDQPPSDVMAMSERLTRAFAVRRFNTTLVGLFAMAALLLASAGIYGTVSYFVSRRIRDLGIRMALGAGGSGIMRLVVKRGVRLAVWGLAIGLVGVWATTSAVESMVYGVGALDIMTLAIGCATLGGIAVAASALPALRATRVPPVTALRAE